jgi:hypothetical protein
MIRVAYTTIYVYSLEFLCQFGTTHDGLDEL